MTIFEPIYDVSQSYVGFSSAAKYDKRPDAHFLIVGLRLENGFLFDAEHTASRCFSVFIRGYTFVGAAVGDGRAA